MKAFSSPRRVGFLWLLATIVGWGLNWPIVKVLLRELPPLFARGSAGLAAALAIAAIAAASGQRLSVPAALVPRLFAASALNVFAWMGLPTLALLWLSVAQTALLVYTMPIWALLLAWPILGKRPGALDALALVLGISGVVVLLAGQAGEQAGSAHWQLGVVLSLVAAAAFAAGTVAWRKPMPLPPLVSVAWQVGLGCLPMVVIGLVFEEPDLGALSVRGWAAMVYMAAVPMALCYLAWFAALRHVPPTTASMATLLIPIIGIGSASIALGEPLGFRELVALVLTLAGVALALRES